MADLSGELLGVTDELLCVEKSPQAAQLQPGALCVTAHLTHSTTKKT